jgi:hypothetical protein
VTECCVDIFHQRDARNAKRDIRRADRVNLLGKISHPAQLEQDTAVEVRAVEKLHKDPQLLADLAKLLA